MENNKAVRRTFKDLDKGDVFEFDHSDPNLFRGLAFGPWRKVAARTYEHVEGRWQVNVGTVNVRVLEVAA